MKPLAAPRRLSGSIHGPRTVASARSCFDNYRPVQELVRSWYGHRSVTLVERMPAAARRPCARLLIGAP